MRSPPIGCCSAWLLVSVAVLGLVFGLMLFYLVRYRYNSPINRGDVAERSFGFEMSWTIATLVVFFGLFIWGSIIYVDDFQPPRNALKVYVVAKQWMWKVEHAGGQREIDALHVPVNKPIELVMTSQDVIHDFFIPAFRVEARRAAGPVRDAMVQGAEDRNLPIVLCTVLRHQPCRDGRRCLCSVRSGLR